MAPADLVLHSWPACLPSPRTLGPSSLAALGARVHAHAFMPLPGTPWGREGPGDIDPATRALLERLASRGAVHGPWKAQHGIARRFLRGVG